MSEHEMQALVSELEMSDFWYQERSIERMLDQALQHRAVTINGPSSDLPIHMYAPSSPSFQDTQSTILAATTTYKTITLKLPPWLKDEEARLLAEVQIREQLDPRYDPTDR